MTENLQKKLRTYENLCSVVLKTEMIHLSRALEASSVIDRALVPAAVGSSFDDVLFGGVLFNTQAGELAQISTAFDICFAALPLWERDGFVLIGPYLSEDAPPARMELILERNHISPRHSVSYAGYYDSLAMLSQEKIRAVFAVLAQGVYEKTLRENVLEFDVTPDFPSPCPVLEEDSLQMRADAIERRYAVERELLHCIAHGDYKTIEAMLPLHFALNRVTNKLRNGKNQSIVLNTLARKSLEIAQIHPFAIDSISAKWAVRIEQAAAVEALHTLQREMLYDYCHMARTHTLARYAPNVRAMLNYVQFNLYEKVALEEIAARLDVNASYLSQQFNREVGKSLPEYVSEKRVAEAKHLLRGSTDLSIGQIAASVGFADLNYFTKTFKRQVGCTPSQYRGKAQREQDSDMLL